MENRKPRASRFDLGRGEARLAHLREMAPTLGNQKRLRIYAWLGSLLLVLTVAAFYLTMQIYRAAAEQRQEASLIEVDRADLPALPETVQVLERLKAEEAQQVSVYEEQLEALKAIDLLENLADETGAGSGNDDQEGLNEPDNQPNDGP